MQPWWVSPSPSPPHSSRRPLSVHVKQAIPFAFPVRMSRRPRKGTPGVGGFFVEDTKTQKSLFLKNGRREGVDAFGNTQLVQDG